MRADEAALIAQQRDRAAIDAQIRSPEKWIEPSLSSAAHDRPATRVSQWVAGRTRSRGPPGARAPHRPVQREERDYRCHHAECRDARIFDRGRRAPRMQGIRPAPPPPQLAKADASGHERPDAEVDVRPGKASEPPSPRKPAEVEPDRAARPRDTGSAADDRGPTGRRDHRAAHQREDHAPRNDSAPRMISLRSIRVDAESPRRARPARPATSKISGNLDLDRELRGVARSTGNRGMAVAPLGELAQALGRHAVGADLHAADDLRQSGRDLLVQAEQAAVIGGALDGDLQRGQA